MQIGMFLLQSSSYDLQDKLSILERENESLQNKLLDLTNENCTLLKDIQDNDSDVRSSMGFIDTLKLENCSLQGSISSLE